MKKAYDRITEAYYDNLGKGFGVKVRDRIHWVCEKATGENILDVGCSQGITAILLGREGKRVCGVDLNSDAINYANEMLANEEVSTREFVQFYSGNYMTMDFEGQKFDSVIFGEILEHITDPKRFIKRASDYLLKEDGKIIITLPFGINDYFDHKKTYYLQEILDFQIDDLYIEEVRFLGKWVGITMKKGNREQRLTIHSDLLGQLESSFYSIERNLLSSKDNLSNKVSNLENKIQEMKGHIHSKDKQVQNLNNQLDEEKMQSERLIQEIQKDLNEQIVKNQQLENELAELKNNRPIDDSMSSDKLKKLSAELDDLRKKEKEYKQQLFNERKSKISVEEQLLASYKKEEALLNSYKKMLRKYESLSKSKLGRLTLSYWKKRKQLVRGK